MKSGKLLQKFRADVNDSLLLEESEKIYWLAKADQMPPKLIEYFSGVLSRSNGLVDRYVSQAIDAHPELVAEIKSKTNKIKQTIAKLRGAEDEQAAEKLLEDQMKQI